MIFSSKSLFLALAAVLLLGPGAAHAAPEWDEQFGEDDDPTPVVQNKTNPRDNRLEATLFFNSTMVDKYTGHFGFQGALTYHIVDAFGIELSGGYMLGSETGIMDQARLDELTHDGDVSETGRLLDPALPDLLQMTFMVMGNAVFTPLYGKLNFVSELDVNADFFFTGGGGVVGTRVATFTTDNDVVTEHVSQGTHGAASVGFGTRVYLTRNIALRAEFRELVFTQRFNFVQENTGQAVPGTDVIWNFMFFGGVSYLF